MPRTKGMTSKQFRRTKYNFVDLYLFNTDLPKLATSPSLAIRCQLEFVPHHETSISTVFSLFLTVLQFLYNTYSMN